MVVGADHVPGAVPPAGANQAPGAAPGGGAGGRHGGTGPGNRNTANAVSKGEARTKFVGNTTGMKGHMFQPRNVSKNANQYHDTVEVLQQYVAKEYETGRELMPSSWPLRHNQPSRSHRTIPHRRARPRTVPPY